MDKRKPIELELFLFGLLAQTEQIFRRSKLSADEMYILVYIRQFGKTLGSDRMVLRRDLTSVMKTVFDRQDSAISKCLNVLLEEGFLSARYLADSERVKLFGTTAGRKTAMVLTERGLSKAEAFSKEVDRLLFSSVPTPSPNLTRDTLQAICAEINKVRSLSQGRPGSKRKR